MGSDAVVRCVTAQMAACVCLRAVDRAKFAQDGFDVNFYRGVSDIELRALTLFDNPKARVFRIAAALADKAGPF